MPQQPVNLTLTAENNDKTFPIGSFTVNIPVHVNRTYRYEVIGSERAIAKLMPPSTNELIKRFENAIKAFTTAFETNPDGRGGEILKTTPNRPTARVVALPLPDDVFC